MRLKLRRNEMEVIPRGEGKGFSSDRDSESVLQLTSEARRTWRWTLSLLGPLFGPLIALPITFCY